MIVLCAFTEDGHEACHPFLPNNEGETVMYGRVTVTLQSEILIGSFISRTLLLAGDQVYDIFWCINVCFWELLSAESSFQYLETHCVANVPSVHNEVFLLFFVSSINELNFRKELVCCPKIVALKC